MHGIGGERPLPRHAQRHRIEPRRLQVIQPTECPAIAGSDLPQQGRKLVAARRLSHRDAPPAHETCSVAPPRSLPIRLRDQYRHTPRLMPREPAPHPLRTDGKAGCAAPAGMLRPGSAETTASNKGTRARDATSAPGPARRHRRRHVRSRPARRGTRAETACRHAAEATAQAPCRLLRHRDHNLAGARFAVEATNRGHAHAHWRDIRARLEHSPLAPAVRAHALGIFGVLADAEARVHGVGRTR